MKNNFNLPEAPIQNNEGILIFSYENTEFVVDVNSKESREECSRELNRISGKHYEWCKETEGKNHWVLYDTAMYSKVYGGDDLNALTYNSGCGLTPIIPVNATSCTAMFEKCEDILDFCNRSFPFFNYIPLCKAEFLMAVATAIFRSRERSERYELRYLAKYLCFE